MSAGERTPVVLAGRYRLAELIGRGGTGEVWRGHDLRRDWPVAVKILSPQVADLSMRERFAREARIAARVVHPNVVTVFDVGEHEGRPYLVMELLTGRDLAAELAEKGPLSISAMCRLAGQAAVGLDTAHRAGVVHRDVKPANLHQSADGVLKVVDFGTARSAAEASMRLTSVGSVIGTAAYLSPEQILGEAGNAASDLYSLGCVCYELLCGRPPFVGSAPEVIFQHVHNAPDSPRRYRPDIPVELERLVLALLQKDPAVRPASGEVVRQVLAAVARQAPPPARDTALLSPAVSGSLTEPRAAKPAPDRLRNDLPGQGAGAALGIVLALMIAVWWISAPSGPAEPPVSTIPAAISSAPAPTTPPPPTSPAVSQSASASPTPSPARTSPSPRSAAEIWRTRLAAFSRAVTDQESQGGIGSRLARETRERISRLAGKIQEGKDKEARDELNRIGRELVEAQRRGRLASTGPLVSFLRDSGLTFAPDDRRPGDHDRDRDRDDDDD
ncbi:protein kinase domain-containing protein [Streptosporangium lutulentum]|uniref:non-specific serine/threonine protein kinase n=1 Tax=Streptosporangium lutulentum TaxID=1461250 RepID=A0ABT9QJD6_9ACTN|nr:protein kinase [Streptosporangium lutulentum]MDP9846867.1 serine/threonine-protein kinase [Streptosporangium lutulentum]